ncbi:MAG: hypothetical protein CVT73_11850 [Alphaproteobacteria bacterium HGW-Alphaproteobacteria-12]|nr:MAG: hypothetical protein CVT73_11850 [Alphaproteobacteria bacterium HGW-Alphaproteobacteria-12]
MCGQVFHLIAHNIILPIFMLSDLSPRCVAYKMEALDEDQSRLIWGIAYYFAAMASRSSAATR